MELLIFSLNSPLTHVYYTRVSEENKHPVSRTTLSISPFCYYLPLFSKFFFIRENDVRQMAFQIRHGSLANFQSGILPLKSSLLNYACLRCLCGQGNIYARQIN
ncbi:unnamed protein product [Cuscuta epithymum]|uniref:Uncharacterized protein n=1 Tax=Cuscuta epithymum TaxID=186058 RepID=A0AAV0EAA0_9ASTE|nr:unnamed protein product [Cuscuta epithymum]CAH9148555.1 unnamed protein product [Cuscuta epithymum]